MRAASDAVAALLDRAHSAPPSVLPGANSQDEVDGTGHWECDWAR